MFLDERSPLRLPKVVIDKIDQLERQVGLPDLTRVYDEVYEMNTRASPQDRCYATKAYKLILCSFRPIDALVLTDAVALDSNGSRDPHVDEVYIQGICSNLLILTKKEPVRFAHLSVIEYLQSESFLAEYAYEHAHAHTAEICLTYMVRKLPNMALVAFASKRDFDVDDFPRYALRYWPYHCERASRSGRSREPLAQLLGTFLSASQTPPEFVKWSGMLCPPKAEGKDSNHFLQKLWACCGSPPTPFFVACAFNLEEVVQDVLSESADKVLEDEFRNYMDMTGLMIAAQYGNLSIVEMLITQGVDLEATDKKWRYTALGHATLAKQRDAILLLAEHGANPGDMIVWEYPRDFGRRLTLFQRTIDEMDMQGFFSLLEAGADIEKANTKGERPLHVAATGHTSAMVCTLVYRGADTGARDHHGRTPLDISYRSCPDPEVSKFLLTRTALVDIVGQNCKGLSLIAEALLDHGSLSLEDLVWYIDIEVVENLGTRESREFARLCRLLEGTDAEGLQGLWRGISAEKVGPEGLVHYLEQHPRGKDTPSYLDRVAPTLDIPAAELAQREVHVCSDNPPCRHYLLIAKFLGPFPDNYPIFSVPDPPGYPTAAEFDETTSCLLRV